MNHCYFDYGENPKTPKFSPMLGRRWRRFWGFGVYICGANEADYDCQVLTMLYYYCFIIISTEIYISNATVALNTYNPCKLPANWLK